MKKEEPNYQLTLQVRDYECDLQGIVNNAVYQNYLEHTRHEYLKTRGYDFASITKTGTHIVITKAEINYLKPLKSGDTFTVTLKTERISPLRIAFHQTITHSTTKTKMLTAKLTATALDPKGKPHPNKILTNLL